MQSPNTLPILLTLNLSIVLRKVYFTPEFLEAAGKGSAEDWRQKAGEIPGAFFTQGSWLLPRAGLEAIGIDVEALPAPPEIDDPDEAG